MYLEGFLLQQYLGSDSMEARAVPKCASSRAVRGTPKGQSRDAMSSEDGAAFPRQVRKDVIENRTHHSQCL
jgi:hypothetical protein